MERVIGFKIGHRFVKIFKWTRCRRTQTNKRQCRTRITNPITGIRSLARCLSRGAKRLCGGEKISGNSKIRLGKDPNASLSMNVVPKRHLVVHVGESDGDTRRVVVPLIYFNHPLFGELLEQAELVDGPYQTNKCVYYDALSYLKTLQNNVELQHFTNAHYCAI
ncbi:hypothetical protein YC2023_023977 [Brassica napus]